MCYYISEVDVRCILKRKFYPILTCTECIFIIWKIYNQNVLVTSMVAADALGIVDTFAACYRAIHVLEEVVSMAYKFTPEDFSREFLENNETLFLGVWGNWSKSFQYIFPAKIVLPCTVGCATSTKILSSNTFDWYWTQFALVHRRKKILQKCCNIYGNCISWH